MAASLFEQVKSLAPPEVVEHLAGALGETPQATDRALTGAAMPAVLGGLVQQFSSGEGPACLLGIVKQQDPDGRLLDNLPAGLKGAAPVQGVVGAAPTEGLSEVEHAGQGVIGSLFGERAGQVADAVAAHAGIGKTSAMSLLSIAGAMILGWLGQRVARGGLDATGLGAMLSNARGELGRIAPPGLVAAIGAPNLAEPSVAEPAGTEPAGVRAAAAPAGAYAASAAAPRDAIYRDQAAGRKAEGAPERPAWVSWLIPALLVLGVAAWLISRVHVGVPQVPTPRVQPPAVPQAQAPAAPTLTAPTAPMSNARTIKAPTVEVHLPNGARLNLASNSTAYGLARYLGDPEAPAPPQRFAFQNVTFPTEGAVLSTPSQGVVNEVAAVLRAHPNARVQVQGFTENLGGVEANLARSQQRAEAVRTALIQRGVAPGQVSARGFGESNPIASNATPTGRAENRRTDLLVVSRG